MEGRLGRSSSSGNSDDAVDVPEPSTSSISNGRHAAGPQARKMRHFVAPLRVDLSNCKYELFRLVAARLGWQVVPEGSNDWDLYWTDTSISQERLLSLTPTQRINHFHGMLEICRKRSMAKNLAALAAALPAELKYDFFPQTWQLPGQLNAFLAAAKAAGKKQAYIVKPDAGCQGKGIKLVQGGPEATVLKNLAGLATLQAVAQQYVTRPFLINGLKFDLRVYVLVTDVDPLRVFIFKEGLVRFCTTPYKKPTSKNLDCAYMHLTNYAVNKTNTEAFVAPASSKERAGAAAAPAGDESASKWTFLQLRQYLESQGLSWSALWDSIGQLIVKSLLSVAPHLAATYRATVVDGSSAGSTAGSNASAGTGSSTGSRVTSAALAAGSCRCFEVLGYDVLLDADVRPWLIEVNHSPSFNIDSPLDRSVKESLIMDVVQLVRLEPSSIASAKKAAKRATQMRLLGPAPARGSSSLLASVGLGSAAADSRADQRAHRDALIAARDRWQDKHLGAFERLYPVPLPGQFKSSSNSSSSSKPPVNFSAAKAAELQDLQDCYDKILRISQQLYQGQLQQQQGQPQPRSPAAVNAFRTGSSNSSSPLKGSPSKREPGGNSSTRFAGFPSRPGISHQRPRQQAQPSSSASTSTSSSSDANNRYSSSDDSLEVHDTATKLTVSAAVTNAVPAGNNTAAAVQLRELMQSQGVQNSLSADGPAVINVPGPSTAVDAALAALSAALSDADGPAVGIRVRARPFSAAGGSRPSSSTSGTPLLPHNGSREQEQLSHRKTPPTLGISRPTNQQAAAATAVTAAPNHAVVRARPQSAPRSDIRRVMADTSSPIRPSTAIYPTRNEASGAMTGRAGSVLQQQRPTTPKVGVGIHGSSSNSMAPAAVRGQEAHESPNFSRRSSSCSRSRPASASASGYVHGPMHAAAHEEQHGTGGPGAISDINAAVAEAHAAMNAARIAAVVHDSPRQAKVHAHVQPTVAADHKQTSVYGSSTPNQHKGSPVSIIRQGLYSNKHWQEQQGGVLSSTTSYPEGRWLLKSHTFQGPAHPSHAAQLQANPLVGSQHVADAAAVVRGLPQSSSRPLGQQLSLNGVAGIRLRLPGSLSGPAVHSETGLASSPAEAISGAGAQLSHRALLRGSSTGGLLGKLRLQNP